MDYNEALDYVYNLVQAVKESEEFKLMIELKEEINTNLKELLDKFDKAKIKYNDALKYGKYHPDLIKYQTELSEIKSELFTNELVTKYKKLEKLISGKLDRILNDVKSSISNKFELTKLIEE